MLSCIISEILNTLIAGFYFYSNPFKAYGNGQIGKSWNTIIPERVGRFEIELVMGFPNQKWEYLTVADL
jgi:hypothetical protein